MPLEMRVPAEAANDGNDGPSHPLTINGRPLSQLVGGSAADSGEAPLVGVLTQDIDGEISGAVTDAAGRPLSHQRVELSRPRSVGEGRLVGMTDEAGRFVYRGLGPGRYEVELREAGRVIARSRPIDLSEGAMHVSGLTVAFPPAQWRPLSTAEPLRLPRTSADLLLAGRPVPESFETLPSILEPGHEVVVMDNDGGRTQARVLSVSRDRLVVSRPRRLFFRPAQERVFTEGTVQRIEIVDSTRNGTLIGTAAAVGLVVGVGLWEERTMPDGNLKGLATFIAVIVAIPTPWIGRRVDLDLNDPIYERPSQPSGVTLAPLLGRETIGVSAHVRF